MGNACSPLWQMSPLREILPIWQKLLTISIVLAISEMFLYLYENVDDVRNIIAMEKLTAWNVSPK